MTMLSAEERAVLGTPAAKRTPAQKKLAKGLETSMRITWEEVAAAVSANAADMARRERLKREIYEIERAASPPSGPGDGTRRDEVEGSRHLRTAPRRLQISRPQSGATAARRAPGFANGRCSPRIARFSKATEVRPAAGAGGMAHRG